MGEDWIIKDGLRYRKKYICASLPPMPVCKCHQYLSLVMGITQGSISQFVLNLVIYRVDLTVVFLYITTIPL